MRSDFGSYGEIPKKFGLAFGIVPLILALIFAFFLLTNFFLASVGAGERGVRFNYLAGGVEKEELGEGWHLKAPWVKVVNYNIRTQEYTMSSGSEEGDARTADNSITAISKDGLTVKFDITIMYHIVPDKVDEIHSTIGPNYQDVIIWTYTRTGIRDIAGEYQAMDMHQQRIEMSDEIFTKLNNPLKEKNIIVEQVLVRSIVRPAQIEQAIENKLQAEQEAMKMEFIIQKEQKEAERKRIEAEGIAKANAIIGQSLTQNYLSWYWISNLDSHNSVIYVPITNQGFPMFKDVDNVKTNITYAQK